MKHISYPSIGQFRNLVKHIKETHSYSQNKDGEWFFDISKKMPSLTLYGSTKVHGTNGGIIIKPDGEQYCVSRNSVLSLENDNAGFATWHYSLQDTFYGMRVALELQFPEIKNKSIGIFGEWAGKSIQKRVGVCNFDKFFYIFGVKVIEDKEETPNYWLKNYQKLEVIGKRIFDKRNFGVFEIEIDFNDPQLVQNKLIELTNDVEQFCPVTKRLMELEGITELDNTIGEGIVFEHITCSGELIQCKVKGEKHSSSKVKKLAEVDVEKLNSINKVVEYVCTENRLQQMANENLEPLTYDPTQLNFDRRNLGKFIKAVSTDVIKEESDTISKSGLSMKDIGRKLSDKAKQWFFEQEEF